MDRTDQSGGGRYDQSRFEQDVKGWQPEQQARATVTLLKQLATRGEARDIIARELRNDPVAAEGATFLHEITSGQPA